MSSTKIHPPEAHLFDKGQERAPVAGPGGEGFRIGPWRVAPNSGKLTHDDGELRHLRPQEMDLLSYLAESAGQVVSREEILRDIWKDAAIEEAAITRCISEIRKALGDEAKAPRFIETIPKRGYRLIAAVEKLTPIAAPAGRKTTSGDLPRSDPSQETTLSPSLETEISQTEPEAAERPVEGRPRRIDRRLFLVAALVFFVSTLTYLKLQADLRESEAPAATAISRLPSAAPSASKSELPRVAVLGFSDLSGSQEASWLSTALSEMLATELASSPQLRVVAGEIVSLLERELAIDTTESLAPDTLHHIRANLGADLVIVGTYLLQGDPERRDLRLDLKFQDTLSGETESGLTLSGGMNRLGELIASTGVEVRKRLGAAPPDRSLTPPARHLPDDPEAVRLYAEGLGKLRRFEAAAARDLLAATIEREPAQPLAHVALAEAWQALGNQANALESVERANELKSDLSRELQLLIEASWRAMTGQPAEAIELYEALWVFAPENVEYGLRLAKAQNDAERPSEALETIERIRRSGVESRNPRLELISAESSSLLGETEQSLASADRAIELGQELHAPSILAQGRLHRAEALHSLGRLEEAIAAIEQAKSAFAATGDRRSEAQAEMQLAAWLIVRGSNEEARGLLSDALETFRDIGDRAGQAQGLRNLAELQWRTQSPTEAKKTLEESIVIFREIRNRSGEAGALNALGALEGSRKNLAESLKYFRAALALFRETGAQAKVSTVLGNLAKLHLMEGKPVEAEANLSEAESLARELGHLPNLGNIQFNRGYCASLTGKTRLGLEAFSESIEIFRQQQNPMMMLASYQGLGEIHLLRGELEAARTQIEETIARRQELSQQEHGRTDSVLEGKSTLAMILLELGQIEAAERIARSLEGGHARSLSTLARVLLKKGQFAEASKLASESTALLEQWGDSGLSMLGARILEARIQVAMGDDLESARESLEAMLSKSRELGVWTLQAQAELAFGEIEIKSGDREKAEARLKALEEDARTREAFLYGHKAADLLAASRQTMGID